MAEAIAQALIDDLRRAADNQRVEVAELDCCAGVLLDAVAEIERLVALLAAQEARLTACESALAKLLDLQTNEQPLIEFYADPVTFCRDMALRVVVDRDEKKHENRQLREQVAALEAQYAERAKDYAEWRRGPHT